MVALRYVIWSRETQTRVSSCKGQATRVLADWSVDSQLLRVAVLATSTRMSSLAPQLCWAIILAGVDAFAAPVRKTPPFSQRMQISSVHMGMHQPDKLEVGPITIPSRWLQIHDCDRPQRWREIMDEEDCIIYREHGSDHEYFRQSPKEDNFDYSQIKHNFHPPGQAPAVDAAAAAAAAASEPGTSTHVTDVAAAVAPGRNLVPTLETNEGFLSACRIAARSDKLVLVKFFSKKCRTCVRMAPKFRQLAFKYQQDIDCYEMEQGAAGPEMLEVLSVTSVPTVQVYDGESVHRLASLDLSPKEFGTVDKELRGMIHARRDELAAFAMIGARKGRHFIEQKRDDQTEKMIDLLLRSNDS